MVDSGPATYSISIPLDKALAPNTTYYWGIGGQNDDETGETISQIRSFTMGGTPPPTPSFSWVRVQCDDRLAGILTATLPATTPDISVAQTSLDFGSIKVGKKVTKTLKITNNGSGDLVITLSGLEGTDFSIQGSSSVTIKAKKSYSLKVLFTPKSAGLETANLEVSSNDPDTPTLEISLSGIGQ